VLIHQAELVGLIPQAALVDAAVWYLQLDQFSPEQILEQKLFAMLKAPPSLESPPPGSEFLDSLASGQSTPGGGSASAYSGAAAAGLVSMVARLTIGRKKYAESEAKMQAVLTQSESLRNDLTRYIQLDASAFDGVMAAYRLPKDSSEQQEIRRKAVEQATLLATQVPIGVANKSLRVLELAEQVIRFGNESALSDGATGAALARAAITGAAYNIRINTKDLSPNLAAPYLTELAGIEHQAEEFDSRVHAALHERGL
jgi:formiminotetrahydrofolate cyclodeaminase